MKTYLRDFVFMEMERLGTYTRFICTITYVSYRLQGPYFSTFSRPNTKQQGEKDITTFYHCFAPPYRTRLGTVRTADTFLPLRDASEFPQKFSPTTHALADSCVQAARTTNQLLSRLFVEGNLAVFGYFDAHYLFSSTLILIISAVMEPAAAISDAVQTAFNLLTAMASNGNVSAKDYLGRLQHIRLTVGNARAEADRRNATAATLQSMSCPHPPELSTESLGAPRNELPSEPDRNFSETLLSGEDLSGEDPLGNPFIESFLAEKAFEWPGGPSPEQEFLREFARELEDEFVFAI